MESRSGLTTVAVFIIFLGFCGLGSDTAFAWTKDFHEAGFKV